MDKELKEITYGSCKEALEAFFDNKFRTSLYDGTSVFTVEAPGGGKIDLSMPRDDAIVIEYRQGTTVPVNAETGMRFQFTTGGHWQAVCTTTTLGEKEETVLVLEDSISRATAIVLTRRVQDNGDISMTLTMRRDDAASARRLNADASTRVGSPENN